MLHHAAIHWPDVTDIELWPLAVLHAVHILNRILRTDTGRSPLELFSRKMFPSSKFHDFHVWGCPVYVLDSTISSGNKIPRWQARSARSVYVGNSLKHGHAVPRVLSLDSGKITAQYHVVYDDEFQTVASTNSEQVNFDHDDWYQTFGLTPAQYVNEDTSDIAVAPDHVIESEGADQLEACRDVRDRQWETILPSHQRESPRSSLQRERDPLPTPSLFQPALRCRPYRKLRLHRLRFRGRRSRTSRVRPSTSLRHHRRLRLIPNLLFLNKRLLHRRYRIHLPSHAPPSVRVDPSTLPLGHAVRLPMKWSHAAVRGSAI